MSFMVSYDPEAQIERPVGAIQAVVSSVVDLGLHADPFHEGQSKRQIAITWQLPLETYKDKTTGEIKNLQQTELYNLSLNEKSNLRKLIEGMTGKPFPAGKISFDLETLVGTNCILTIQKKSETEKFTHVMAAAPLMKGMTSYVPKPMPIPQWVLDFKTGSKSTGSGTVVDPSDSSSKQTLENVLAKI